MENHSAVTGWKELLTTWIATAKGLSVVKRINCNLKESNSNWELFKCSTFRSSWPHSDALQLLNFSQPATQSVSQSPSQSVSQSVSQSISQSASQPVSPSVSQSVSQPVSQPVKQSVNQSFSQSVSQSISQPASQSVSQSVSQSFSQSISRSVSVSTNYYIYLFDNQSSNPTVAYLLLRFANKIWNILWSLS